MTEPFLGEVRIMSFSYAPKGWALCNGQTMGIAQNSALFALLGTTYGGNGQTTFLLPNLQGKVPLHFDNRNFQLGQNGGEQSHTLSSSEMPQHTHGVAASSATTGGNADPTGRFLGGGNNVYHAPASPTTISPQTVGNAGGSQAHQNMQPFLTVSFCIALQGIFPSRN